MTAHPMAYMNPNAVGDQQAETQIFRDIIKNNGLSSEVANILTRIVCEINNQYYYANYNILFPTYYQEEDEYTREVFKYVAILAMRSNMSYLNIFFDEYDTLIALPVYRRLMIKRQSGSDRTIGESSVNLKNSNSPINTGAEVISPTSKSNSASNSESEIRYGNITDYDNISETEKKNYYANLETIITWVRKHWFDPLIYELQVNNY